MDEFINPNLLVLVNLLVAASKSALGVISLFAILFSVISLLLFRDSKDWVKVIVFMSMLLGAIGFGYAVFIKRNGPIGEPGFRHVDIQNSDSRSLYLEDINCKGLLENSVCDFYVLWSPPAPGMQAIIRVGENNEGYFACGSIPHGVNRKMANWGVLNKRIVLRYFEVKAEGPSYGCTDKVPQVEPRAVSVLTVQ